MGTKKIDHLVYTPRARLGMELAQKLNTALSEIDPEIRRTNLVLQLLELRIKSPAKLVAKWHATIQLWYKIANELPAIAEILSDYDLDYQLEQNRLIFALSSALSEAR